MLEGRRISDRYKVMHLIGGGGMSHVYLAHDMILDREVAIKVLRYDFKNEEELLRRFQREALSVTSLAHLNIVGIYDVGQDEDIHYIVMEYVEGQTLKQYIQKSSPIPVQRAVDIMRSLTNAISHAHDNHLIHRDIKPQNVLMTQDGEVKVTDFGIAVTLNATAYTQTNSVLGTVHYLSPEQARGGMATKKSDIYALGVVLYELLTGELPFYGESPVAIALKHLQEETPSVRAKYSYIPQSVENVVLKATAKDPLHRYNSVEEMEQDLMTVLSPERLQEKKFELPLDDDATKAMPVIKPIFPKVDETLAKRGAAIIDDEDDDDVILVAPTKPLLDKQERVQDEPPPKKKKSRSPLVIGLIVGCLAFIALLIFLLPSMMMPAKVAVPDVLNLPVEEAMELLEEQGFTIGEERER
ncbi:MAG: Stk1 family PASTA domain-containing Ser/Thr kinase, partial [Caryophanon sp.]|nr:Stk1 family PASTA domain-containing Ser/Thr kinase [Caryophanon sp.]